MYKVHFLLLRTLFAEHCFGHVRAVNAHSERRPPSALHNRRT
jgi:hypothetical protein